MTPLSYVGYRFPPEIIQHAIWLYLRFTLSFRDVEELLAERGIDVSHETIRRWVAVFGPMIARRLRAMRPKPHRTWHLDEMFVSIGGKSDCLGCQAVCHGFWSRMMALRMVSSLRAVATMATIFGLPRATSLSRKALRTGL